MKYFDNHGDYRDYGEKIMGILGYTLACTGLILLIVAVLRLIILAITCCDEVR